jgi:transglutaminase-like putative cysteine protease
VLTGVALVVVASCVGLILGPRLPGANDKPRLLLRTYVEPDLDPSVYPSPLSATRRSLLLQKDAVLFTIAGLPEGERVRLAVMDSWDGTAMAVAGGAGDGAGGAFRRVGDAIPAPTSGQPTDVTVTIGEYNDVWAPVVGQLTSVAADGARQNDVRGGFRYDLETATGLVTGGLTAGDVLKYGVVIPPRPSEEQLKSLPSSNPAKPPLNAPLPESLRQYAGDAIGDATGPYERVDRITRALADGFYTPRGVDDTPPGHGSGRLTQMMKAKEIVGDEEQYGALAALMARFVDVPARLVLGYAPSGQGAGAVEVKGSDLTVWLEVPLAGAGWVAVTPPTPPRTKLPTTKPDPKPKPRPQVQVPPPPAADVETPALAAPASAEETANDDPEGWSLPSWVGKLLVGVGIPLLLLASALGGILLAKSRRARRRREDPDPSRAVTNGWLEYLDAARDHRLDPPLKATRTEVAGALDAVTASGGVAVLASRADAAAFGPTSPSDSEVASYWSDVDTAKRSLSDNLGLVPRWRAKFSLRSLSLGRRTRRATDTRGAG